MRRPYPVRIVVIIAGALACLLLLGLGYLGRYRLKEVALEGGTVRIQVPSRWAQRQISEHETIFWPPAKGRAGELLVSTLLMTREKGLAGDPAERTLALLPGEAPISKLPNGNAFRTWTNVTEHEGTRFYHRHWHLASHQPPKTYWLVLFDYSVLEREKISPGTLVDLALLANVASKVRFDKPAYAKTRHQLSPASRVIEERLESAGTPFVVILYTVLAFVGSIPFFHFLLLRVLRPSKAAWYRIGQLTIFVSFVALLLASWSFYGSRLRNEVTAAEIAAQSEAEKGQFFVSTLKELCDNLGRGFTISLAENWRDESSREAEYDCEALRPALEILEGYWFRALGSKVRSGQFVDPYWKIGLPVDLDTNHVQGEIMRLDGLDDWQKEVLLSRTYFFMETYIREMRFIQRQQDNLFVSEAVEGIARFWGVAVALALALNYTKAKAQRLGELAADAEADR